MSNKKVFLHHSAGTFFTYHLDIFNHLENVTIQNVRRISKTAFNINVIVKVDVDLTFGFLEGEERKDMIMQQLQHIYVLYTQSERFVRGNTYEECNAIIQEYYDNNKNDRWL